MLEKQNGKCCLCDNEPTDLDHCHKTGIHRGLLCSSCNLRVGTIERDLEWILRSVDYIRKDHAPNEK